jgi:hypothetical protein
MKVIKDERGMFHPLLIGLIVVVVAAIGFAGYKVSNKNDKKSVTPTAAVASNSAAESACNKEISDKTFCKFVSHFSLNSAYKATIASTDSSGMVSKVELQNDSKSNSTMVTKDANGKETSAFITLDNSSYIKDESDNSWTKYTSSTATDTTKPTSDIKIDTNDITSKNTISYKNLGTEACGKLTCYKYQVVDSANAGTTQYIWFDNKNYMMQRWYSKDANGTMDMSFTYQSVNITAPSPVKEASTQSGANAADVNAAIQAAQQSAQYGSQ